MKLATWNVNSLRVRLPHVIDWLAQHHPDILCLQETKILDDDFPAADFAAAGYRAIFAGQKSYNGMAILSRAIAADVCLGLPEIEDGQRRLLAATFGDLRVVNVYVPNGQAVGSEKYAYKLAWLTQFKTYLARQLQAHPRLAVVGDFNIAPEDRDVHDPALWQGSVMVSDAERAALRELLALGMIDVFRAFEQPAQTFSWWDYRMGAFRRNRGLRIDLILCSPALRAACRACVVDSAPRRLERPSDHAPVVAEFDPG